MRFPATPGWGPLAAVVCGVWCVVCGVWCAAVVCWWGCGWSVVWLVPRHSWRRFPCATPRHSWLGFAAGGGGRSSPLLAEGPGRGSPPLLAGFRCRRWCVVCGVWCVVCGVWRWCVGGVVAGVWCGWSLATPGGGSCVLPPATRGWVSLPVVVGVPRHSWLRVPGAVPRHSWLGFAVGGGGCSSPLLAEGPGCGSPPLMAVVRWRRWCVVCGVWCVVCGVWCAAVVCWWGCGWCVVWLVPRHSWRRFLCATPRHSWLGFAAGGGGRSSPLLAESPGCGSPPLLAGVRRRWWCAAPRHSWLGSAGGGGVFRGWGRPLLCVFVVYVHVRGASAVLCVAYLWCLRCWWCGVVVWWVCLPRVLVCVVACVWCAGGLRFGVPAPCLSWPWAVGVVPRHSWLGSTGCGGGGPGCPSPWSWCVCVRCVALRVGVGGAVWLPCVCVCVLAVCGWWGVSYLGWFPSSVGMVVFKKQKKKSCRCVAEMRGMRDAYYVPLYLSHRVFFPCRERACAGLLGGRLVVFACCALYLLLFFVSVASSITLLFALRFPYREGVGGACVFFFFVTYLSYLVQLLVVIPYRESVCLFVGWAGVGFHTMFLLCLISVFLHLATLCTFVFSCAVRPFGAFPRILNILVRHTIVSPWCVAIPYSESVCVFAGGAGWGFIPCFSLLLSLSSCTLRSCFFVCVCAWSVPLAPSFAFLTYLLSIPLFPRGSWASPIARACAGCVGGAGVGFHTMFLFDLVSIFFHFAALCTFWYACVVRSLGALLRIFNILVRIFIVSRWSVASPYLLLFLFFFFSRVSRGARSLWRNMGNIWLPFVFLGMPFDVRGGSSFFSCVRRCPLGALLRNILGFLIYACVAVDMICRMHGAVTYLFVIPLFSRGPWSCFLCLWFGVSPFVVFPSFFFF